MNQTIQHFSCLFYQVALVRIILQFIIYNEKSTAISTEVKPVSPSQQLKKPSLHLMQFLFQTKGKYIFYKVLKLSNRCVFVFLILQNVTLLFFSNSTAIIIKR